MTKKIDMSLPLGGEPENHNALAGQVDPLVMRLRKKLAKRDRRIEALEKRIAMLEIALGTRTLDLEMLSRNVERSGTNALCNVRMNPVFWAWPG